MEYIGSLFTFLNLQELLPSLTSTSLRDLIYLILSISSFMVVFYIFKLLIRRGNYRYISLIPISIFLIIFLTTSSKSTSTKTIISEIDKNNKSIKLKETRAGGKEILFIDYNTKDTKGTYSISTEDQEKIKKCNNFKYVLVTYNDQYLILGNNIISTPSKPSFEIQCY